MILREQNSTALFKGMHIWNKGKLYTMSLRFALKKRGTIKKTRLTTFVALCTLSDIAFICLKLLAFICLKLLEILVT